MTPEAELGPLTICTYMFTPICHTQHEGGREIPAAYMPLPNLVFGSLLHLRDEREWTLKILTSRLPTWSAVCLLSHGSTFLGSKNRSLPPNPEWKAQGFVTIIPSSQAAPRPAPSESGGSLLPSLPTPQHPYRENLLGSGVTGIWSLAHMFCLLVLDKSPDFSEFKYILAENKYRKALALRGGEHVVQWRLKTVPSM